MSLARLIHGGIGQTEHDPPEQAQHPRRIGCPNAAGILVHRHIQAVMQPAFNDPVVAFELQQAQSRQLLQG